MIIVGWDMQVGVNYDPMIAKVIARGPDRQSALRKMYTALSELQVCGSRVLRYLAHVRMPSSPSLCPTC